MRFIGKLSRDKRGVGSLVGAAFLILILATGFAFYILNLRTTEHYDQTLQEMSELDYDRSREKIVIEEVAVTDAKLSVTVKNEGPIPSHLILLGGYNDTLPPQYDELDRQVNPAETLSGVEMGDQFKPGNQYTIQVITELGNIAVYSYPSEEESWFPPPEYFGVFSQDWFYFEYTSKQQPDPIPAGAISKGNDNVAFYIRVTNNWNESVTISNQSTIRFLVFVHGQPEPDFYIVDDVDYNGSPQISAYSTPITVEPQKSAKLIFAAEGPGNVVWKWGGTWPAKSNEAETAIILIGLVFKIGGSPVVQAQSLPFRAVYLPQ